MIRTAIALVLSACGAAAAPIPSPSEAGARTPDVSSPAPLDAGDAGCVPERDDGLIAANQGPVRAMVVDETRVYWTVSNGTSTVVRARDKTQCSPIVTIASFPDIGDIPDLIIDAETLYLHIYHSWSRCKLASCTSSLGDWSGTDAFALDSTRLFFTVSAEGGTMWMVSCVKEDCSFPPVFHQVTWPVAIASNGTNVFWSRNDGIYTSNVAGTYAPTKYVGQPATLLRIDTHYLAWVTGQDLFACWIPCTTPQKMGTGSVRQLAIGSGRVFWIDGLVAGDLKACAESGCSESPSTIVNDEVSAFAVDTNDLYWAANGMIRRSPF